MNTSNDKIKIRKRKTKAGNYSIYLDTYDNGRRKYEYLRLYLIPEKTREDKRKNRETLQLAETIRAKRLIELRNGKYGIGGSESGSEISFFAYFSRLCTEPGLSKSTLSSRQDSFRHVRAYEPREISFADVTQQWIEGFKRYLDAQPLKQNTKALYFQHFKTCINRAYKEGIISDNPLRRVSSFSQEEGQRMYLTIEEVQRLASTPCKHPEVKRAFLFSCLTGLRRSDIVALRWEDVHREGAFTRIIFRQRKTHRQEYLDINAEASQLLGAPSEGDTHVFRLPIVQTTCDELSRWTASAGITKHITFHCARHTFATLLLSLGTDLYTVSKLLGHSNTKTTEIYAKVIDRSKQQAVASIPHIMTHE